MSLTVESCLKLPSFSSARLVAGAKGLGKPVSSITVLEYADASVIDTGLFLNNEICITAFTSCKNDVEAQCAVLRKMKHVGISAVVLYYIGIFVPYLDDRMVITADEIDLPLICMPSNRFDFRYGEMINDVMYAIYRNQERDTNFVSEMLDSIFQLPEGLRTIRNVLRMLSDHLHCSFYLLDQSGALRAEGQWPLAAQWNYQPLLDLVRSDPRQAAVLQQRRMVLEQREVYVTYAIVSPERIPYLHLLVFDEQHTVASAQVDHAAEIIALFLNVYNYTFEETTPDMMVRAIISDEPLRMREIAAQHGINTSQIQSMWVLHEKKSSESPVSKQKLDQYVSIARGFFRKHQKWILADSYQNSVIILFKTSSFVELDAGLAEEFLSVLEPQDSRLSLISFSGLLTTRDARTAYQLLEKCFDTAQLLFPTRNLFDLHDLHFAEQCMQVLSSGEPEISNRLYPLQPLRQLDNYELMLRTLSVFLLDTNANLQRTADLLFVHKNTIKYRMGRIRETFNCDISRMPVASALYEAVAIHRLLE